MFSVFAMCILASISQASPAPNLTDAYCTPGSNCWPLARIQALVESLSEDAEVLEGSTSQTAAALFMFCTTPGAFNKSQLAGHSAPALSPALCEGLQNLTADALSWGEVYANSYTMNVIRFKLPGLVVRARTAEDIVQTVDFARASNVKLAVRNTGHAYNGQSSVDGGVVLDMSRFGDIQVDAEAKLLTCGGGATWGPVYEAANKHGFVVVGGHDPTVGVVGCMLGGCHGEFSRKYGFTADNIVEMQVVVPGRGAEVLTVSNASNPDLFWAMRGGGPGFGVVLSVTMRMHPAPPSLHWLSPVSLNPLTPLCYGLEFAANKTKWWAEEGASTLKRVLFNATWWESLSEDWTFYNTECSFSLLLYSGNNVTAALQEPAMEAALQAMGPLASWKFLANFSTQVDYHLVTADRGNFYPETFTSFLPTLSDLSAVADELAAMHVDGMLTGLEGGDSLSINSALGGRAATPAGNAVGSLRAGVFEITLSCQTEVCQQASSVAYRTDHEKFVIFEGMQAIHDRLEPLSHGKYINEWTSQGGFALPTPDDFWSQEQHGRLMSIKQQADPCNVLNVEAGVGWDLQHCGAEPLAKKSRGASTVGIAFV